MSKRIVICTGGNLGAWALEHIRKEDYLIGADSGALFLVNNGLRPDLAIGDFDSVTAQQLDAIASVSVDTKVYDPVDKDYTDTELAFRQALDGNPSEILVLGALGSRFDHTLANIHLLAIAEERGVKAFIIDKHNRIALTTSELMVRRGEYSQVSLLPLTETVTGITLTGFQYPLTDATIKIGQSLGISNVLTEETGRVKVSSGKLLVIQSRD